LAALLPSLAGWRAAGRPFDARRSRWLSEGKLLLPSGSGDAVASALADRDEARLGELIRDSADPSEPVCELSVFYVPRELDPELPAAFLSARECGPMRKGHRPGSTVFTHWGLTVGEFTCFRPPLPTGAVPAAGEAGSPAEEIGPLAAAFPVPDSGQMFTAESKAKYLLSSFGVMGISALLVIGGGCLLWFIPRRQVGPLHVAPLAVGLATFQFVTFIRRASPMAQVCAYQRNRFKRVLAARADPWLDPDDSDLRFAAILPRVNQHVLMFDDAADVRFLKLVPDRRLMVFEGDRHRWLISAEAVVACEAEERTGPDGKDLYGYALSMLARTADGEVELSFDLRDALTERPGVQREDA
jgi:hypothetical protein